VSETPNIKVLVVDDLPEKLLVYRTILESPGLELIMAQSGREALRQLLQHDFAVVLLDVNMPGMDGYETAEIIRTRKKQAHTPIIFITSYADELHALKGYAYGAVDYILAPVIPEVLRTKVRVFVELYRKSLEVQRQADELRDFQAREHQRQLWETNERLRIALEAGLMGACEWDLKSRLLSWSPTLETIFGFATGEFSGEVERLVERLHPDDRDAVHSALAQAIQSKGDVKLDHRIIRDGRIAWVELRGKVFVDQANNPARMAGVCMDITDRKQAESELAESRSRLEELVLQRTAELKASHEKLRLADRLASIGTLAAGLGHDMGNLLLPIRARIASLEIMDLPSTAKGDIEAIKTAGEYLQRLSKGLRLFALDPSEQREGEHTHLSAWWMEVSPFFRNVLPKFISFESMFPADLPPIDMPSHTFTQVVYNLVQNAGEALRGRDRGRVALCASLDQDSQFVSVQVSDDGVGMSEEIRLRCMEPFFTTRTRQISTGLGLALVRGAVHGVGGSIDIESKVNEGTTFKMRLPVKQLTESLKTASGEPAMACVAVADRRLQAYVNSILRESGVALYTERWTTEMPAHLLVIDNVNGCLTEFERFLQDDDLRRAVVFQSVVTRSGNGRIVSLEGQVTPSRIRGAIHQMLRNSDSARQGVLHS